MTVASLLRVGAADAESIVEALARRKLLSGDERKEALIPPFARTSRKGALLWALGAMRQDRPVFFWLGTLAATTQLLYVIASAVISLLR